MNGADPISTSKNMSSSGLARWLALNEAKLILFFAFALFALNFATALDYPTCWMDETLFSDPAICAAQGKGFVSTVWWQSRTLIWSGNVPLYDAVLILWLKAFGISLVKVRAFNYAVISTTLVIFWLGIKRLKLVASAPMRMGMIVTVFLSYDLMVAYRSARPDCLGMLLCATAMLAWSWERRLLSCAVLFAVGLLAPISGLQLGAYLGFLCVPVWLAERNKSLFRLCLIMAGVAIGAAALFSWYHVHHLTGVQETGKLAREFHERALTGGSTKPLDAMTRVRVITTRIFKDQFKDYSIMPTLVALLFLACDRKNWAAANTRFLLLFGLLSTMALVSALQIFLHYLDYYHWMNYILLAVALFALLDRIWGRLPVASKGVIILLLAGSIAGGLPMRLSLGMAMKQNVEYAQFEKLAAEHVGPSDVVFCDFMGYFPAKTRAADVFEPPYLKAITAAERKSVNVLVLDPVNSDAYRAEFATEGQKWEKVGEVISQPGSLGHLIMRLFPHYATQVTNCGYSIVIFRRVANP